MVEWYSTLSPATIPAWLGLAISVALAIVKLCELWAGRFKINVAASFTGDVEYGNTIYIRNLSPKAVILTHWRVYYARRFWPFAKKETAAEADFDMGDVVIDKTSTYDMHFTEAEYFSWGHKKLQGRAIFIKLYFAGHREVKRRIYPH